MGASSSELYHYSTKMNLKRLRKPEVHFDIQPILIPTLQHFLLLEVITSTYEEAASNAISHRLDEDEDEVRIKINDFYSITATL